MTNFTHSNDETLGGLHAQSGNSSSHPAASSTSGVSGSHCSSMKKSAKPIEEEVVEVEEEWDY